MDSRQPIATISHLERRHCQGEVLRAFQRPAVFRIDGEGGQSGIIESFQQLRLLLGPFVRVARSLGY